MRAVTWILALSALGQSLLAATAWAAPPKADMTATMTDELAQRLFQEADRNRNHHLNKSEFRDAQDAVENAVMQMGRNGLIGKPLKGKAAAKNTEEADFKKLQELQASADKLAKSSKISEAEFGYYVHGVVEQADKEFRQMNAATAAQRKAMQQQNAQRSQRRRMMRQPHSTNISPFYDP